MQQVLDRILEETRKLNPPGQVADYIPALQRVNPDQIALSVATVDGQQFSSGDWDTPFSVQSVTKIYSLILAMFREGDSLWQRVGMEPSGQAFNSIVQLEWEHGIPRNPFINAGAIVVSDVLVERYSASRTAYLSFVRQLANNDKIRIDRDVYQSEKEHGHRNAALAHLMKSFHNLHSDVPTVLDQYFYQCSVAMTTQDLAHSFAFLANKGICPFTKKTITTVKQTRQINALLSTSGMYDQSGTFAFEVGLPAKSGVGGGIVAIIPNQGVICAWSPKLNEYGNSAAGMIMIKQLVESLGLSVY
ncbi:glutaminase [Algicola sagamiensis]|uniref:glutaminase n=1 Tax=Algicola sagamiensis TaxID=163869 RepID=UPI000382E3BA|nr:glutaminase [Algicola sagamiensis]